ncbi:MAG: HD domain-containing protein [Candidatus Thorarchaeota archaeon]
MSYYDRIDSFAKQEMTQSDAGAHAYDHVKRVYSLVMRIGAALGADLRILGAAALLHDIGRAQEEESGISHSILSGEMSVEILKEVGFDQDEIQRVKDTIRTHRFSEGLTPTSLEGEILSDADKLDALGAIGVVRAIAQAATTGVGAEAFLRHADEKLLKLHQMMYTEEGKKIAQARHLILKNFVNELRKELGNIESKRFLS